MSVYGGLRVHSVTILRRHYFGVFQRTKKRNPINKGFQLLGYLEIPQFRCSIAEVRLGSNTSLMVRIDGTVTSIGPDLTNDELIGSVEGALSLGADAVATFGVIGVPREAQLSHKIAMVSEECERLGMPQLTEMIPSEILTHQFADRAKRKWPSDPEVVKYSV